MHGATVAGQCITCQAGMVLNHANQCVAQVAPAATQRATPVPAQPAAQPQVVQKTVVVPTYVCLDADGKPTTNTQACAVLGACCSWAGVGVVLLPRAQVLAAGRAGRSVAWLPTLCWHAGLSRDIGSILS